MIATIDRYLDHVTSYRLVLLYLAALLGAAFVFAVLGWLPMDPAALAFSSVIAVGASWLANRVFAAAFEVPVNTESVYITALIVVLIFTPVGSNDLEGMGALVFASVWAVASKFVFALGRRHIFNPAAFGAVVTALLLDHPASWWIAGAPLLLPVVIVGGLLTLRKLERFDLVATFLLAHIGAIALTTQAGDLGFAFDQAFTASPILFFAFVMLTEPLTAPPVRWGRLVYAAAAGVLMAPEVNIGGLYFAPELALVVVNLAAFALWPRRRTVLTLERAEKAAAGIYDFIFRPDAPLAFEPGQYLEWTLPVDRPDSRGNRRYFTLASAPTEPELRLGVKIPAQASAFKRALALMRPGDEILASPPAGAFTLPRNPDAKLTFLAAGIGITPFRSMLQDLIDRRQRRPISVLYAVQRPADIAYGEVLDAAATELGIPTVYVVEQGAGAGQVPGIIDERLLRRTVPDFRERTFYVSGPQAMVEAVRVTLRRMGVSPSRVRTDFFPGFA
jgi:ferredoxin-NADP reductase